MSDTAPARLDAWLIEPMDAEVSDAITRLRRAPDVQAVAVMPDVHLARDVCIGVAVATTTLIYPQAVGGDIGCGVLAVPADIGADGLADPQRAARVLSAIGRAVPGRRRNRRDAIGMPADVQEGLSHCALTARARDDAATEFATLGSGNHFIELQADEGRRLWLMVHSGSRAIGPAIRDHHLARAAPPAGGLRALDATGEAGLAYLRDVGHARRYAEASRRAIAREVDAILSRELGARLCWESLIATDHNHVVAEVHDGQPLWIHRKGAMPAALGEQGVLPGSMGTASFHVEGRGHEAALCSSAHGAGRALSLGAAREAVSARELSRQMAGVWHDCRRGDRLRDEAPSAYKDVRAVLRAQRDLVKVVRTLRPILNYKSS